MHGYLTFLKQLTEDQQRSEIGILAFRERWPEYLSEDPLVDDVMLQHPSVVAYSQKLGVAPFNWESEIDHDLQWAEPFGSPVFHPGKCLVPFSFRYECLAQRLVVKGITYVDDLGNTVMSIQGCDIETTPSFQLHTRERLIALGIDAETWEPLPYEPYDEEMAHKPLYLEYLRALLPGQQQDAIYHLIRPDWLRENPKYLLHPTLAAEIKAHGMRDLIFMDGARINLGVPDFSAGRCTVPLGFCLEEDRAHYDDQGYLVEVHLLVRIENRPGGGGEIAAIEDAWMRTQLHIGTEEDHSPVVIDET
jgi:hypothetical protein